MSHSEGSPLTVEPLYNSSKYLDQLWNVHAWAGNTGKLENSRVSISITAKSEKIFIYKVMKLSPSKSHVANELGFSWQ